jgi:glycerol-3-phosphate dehydrogenase
MTRTVAAEVLIIGGGITGTGLARDLALRGIAAVVVEAGNINSGASGRNHGLLHSGARYVASDPVSARECKEEGDILKRIAPQCIENTSGLFVAVRGDDEDYISRFPGLCISAGIPCRKLDIGEARYMEPGLSGELIAAFQVEDASVDPFHLSQENMNQAIENGAQCFPHCRVTGFQIHKTVIQTCRVKNLLTTETFRVIPRVVVNAAGAWAGHITAMAGIPLEMIYSKGTLLITHHRINRRIINRLRPPADGDILVPGGTVSIFGTTSVRLENLDTIQPSVAETDFLVARGAQLVPELATIRYVRSYAGVRPLVKSISTRGPADDRSVSRGFSLIDHEEAGCDNLITITGGKLTTFRLMAEKTADRAALKLRNTASCTTDTVPLRSGAPSQLTEAGLSGKTWIQKPIANDPVMCECEMIPVSHFEHLIAWLRQTRKTADLNALRIHSRLGKGACQGTFCSLRVAGYMYDEQYLEGDQGIYNIKDLLQERFKGQRPVLWGSQLIQAELSEAIYCGVMGLDKQRPYTC